LTKTNLCLTLFSLLLFILPLTSKAQSVICEINREFTCPVPYFPDTGSWYRNGNEILIELAKDVLREPHKIRIEVKFNLQIRLMKTSEGKFMTALQSGLRGIYGDHMYRGFDISRVLKPSGINLTLRSGKKSDPALSREQKIADQSFGNPDNIFYSPLLYPFDPATDTLAIADIGLFYDESAKIAFCTRLGLINDYYASCALLDTLNRLSMKINLDNPSELPLNYIRVREIDMALEIMKTRNFQENLLIMNEDPKQWQDGYLATYKKSRSLTFTFQDELKQSGIIPWDGKVDLLAAYFVNRVLAYIRLSHQMSEIHGNIYGDYLDHYYQSPAFEEEAWILDMLTRKMFPDAYHDTVMTFLSTRLYLAYQDTARWLIRQKQFAEAYDLMVHASRLSDLDPNMNMSQSGSDLRNEAANGIFESYVGIAQACLLNRKYSLAGEYLDKADVYREGHPEFRFSDTLFRSALIEFNYYRLLTWTGTFQCLMGCHGSGSGWNPLLIFPYPAFPEERMIIPLNNQTGKQD